MVWARIFAISEFCFPPEDTEGENSALIYEPKREDAWILQQNNGSSRIIKSKFRLKSNPKQLFNMEK